MTPEQFVKRYYTHAANSEAKHKISAVFILAQAALESGWGKSAPGFNFFGIKDRSGVPAKRQLLRTTEYSNSATLKFPEIISIERIEISGKERFKYTIRDWFRKYDSAEEAFDDHALFFYKNPRYRQALGSLHNPRQFAVQVAKAGYATDPNYARTLIRIIDKIEEYLPEK
jgi:flagellum-specific peptidoglycan hydrolase FlgJ